MSENKYKIVLIIGTKREKRKSAYAAKFIEKIGQSYSELDISVVDPNDFELPGDGNDPEGRDPKYTEITAAADGFFIVVPEYNHSFPGSLKRLLDSELENYNHKPVAMAGVSSGRLGGARAVEHLTPILRELGLVATSTNTYFFNSYDLFDGQGNMAEDQTEFYKDQITKALDELVWMTKALKYGRENI